jgi:hypothetical protein
VSVPQQDQCPPQYQVENVDYSYNLEDLLKRIDQGWEELRDLASLLGLSIFRLNSKFADPTRRLDERLEHAIYDVLACCDDTRGLFPWLIDFAAEVVVPLPTGSPCPRSYFHDLSVSDRLEVCRRLAAAFTHPTNVMECIRALLPPEALQAAVKERLFGRLELEPEQCCLSPSGRMQFAWILEGTKSHEACDAAWWKCVTAATKEMGEILLAIQTKVRRREPITEDEHESLQEYLVNASPRLVWVYDDDDSGQYIVKVKPDFQMINRYPIYHMAMALAIPPAYVVARELEDSMKEFGNRFVVACRNPQCGRTFYSGRKDAVACPKKPHERVTSPCKRAWDKYKRWLVRCGYDPDAVWNRDDLKKQYLSDLSQGLPR